MTTEPETSARPTYPGQLIAPEPHEDFFSGPDPMCCPAEPSLRGWWVMPAIVAAGYTLAVFTLGAIAGSVFG